MHPSSRIIPRILVISNPRCIPDSLSCSMYFVRKYASYTCHAYMDPHSMRFFLARACDLRLLKISPDLLSLLGGLLKQTS